MHLRFTTPFEAGAEADGFLESLPSCPAVFALFPAAREGVPVRALSRAHRDLRRRLRGCSPPGGKVPKC